MDIKEYIEELEGKTPRFARLITICTAVWDEPRIRGSHHFSSTPWAGTPLVNLQKGKGGKAEPRSQVDLSDPYGEFDKFIESRTRPAKRKGRQTRGDAIREHGGRSSCCRTVSHRWNGVAGFELPRLLRFGAGAPPL